MWFPWAINFYQIHRHTGGLENVDLANNPAQAIHRHTGGLENDGAENDLVAIADDSPPHRRLRKIHASISRGRIYSPPHRRLRKQLMLCPLRDSYSPPHRRLRKMDI